MSNDYSTAYLTDQFSRAYLTDQFSTAYLIDQFSRSYLRSISSKPIAQPTSLVFSNVAATSMTLTWTAASPAPLGGYIVLRDDVAVTDIPTDNTTYSVGNTIGAATVAYVGSALTFDDSGLLENTLYYYAIFSYQGSPSQESYLTISPLTGSQITTASFYFLQAFSLDGVNDYFSRASVSSFSDLTKMDVAMWVYIDATATVNQVFIDWRATVSAAQGFQLSAINIAGGMADLRFTIWPNDTSAAHGRKNACISLGAWHFIVFKFDGTATGNANRMKIKLDDVWQTLTFTGPAVPAVMGTTTQTFNVGRNVESTVFYKGKIDHVAIKHGTWSDGEDTLHYNAGSGAAYANYNEFWSADNTPNDSGANALHLTASNGATYASH